MPSRAAVLDNEPVDLGIGLRRARARLVEIEAAPGLLAEAAAFAQADRRSERSALAPCACASSRRARQGRLWRTDPWETRNRSRPHRRLAASAPSSNRRSASTDRIRNMRLPTKPWHTPTTAGILPSLRLTAMAVASVSGEVAAPRTTSTRRMTFAGLKKCIPTTACGRSYAPRQRVDIEIGGIGGEDGAALWRRDRDRRRPSA